MRIDTFTGKEKKLLFWEDSDDSIKVKEYMIQNKLTGIVFSRYFGFEKSEVTIHAPFEFVDEVHVLESNMENISFIYNFPNAKTLNIQNEDKTKIDFGRFEDLEDLFIYWQKGMANLSDRKKLKILCLHGFKEKIFDISPQTPLEELRLYKSPVENLSSLGALKTLKSLMFFDLRCLEDITWLQGLENLETIYFQRCRKIKNWDMISRLPNLKVICLDRCGTINDINFLKPLENLERVVLAGDTKLISGAVRWLYEKPKITYIGLPWRKDFDITLEESQAGEGWRKGH